MSASVLTGTGPRLAADIVSAFDGPAGAYVHVPFCSRICPFCPYNKVLAEPGLAQRYFRALAREIDWYAAALAARQAGGFTSLYVGGGTPTLYPDELASIVARVPATGERAVEVLPNHATRPGLDRLATMGITAVSIGAQSFDDRVLHRLRRPHDAATAREAVENAVGRFACVDVDLIVDVEWDADGTYRDAFLRDFRTCLALGVDQVSTYPLMRFGYTPFGTAAHNRRLEHEVLRRATELAAAFGYERRSVWTYNRPDALPYTSITRRRFLGMGAGSSSFAGSDFYVNHFGVGVYADAVERDRLPVARWLRLGRWGGAAYDAFWQAYAGGVDVDALGRSYGRAVRAAATALLVPFAAGRLMVRSGSAYRLTARGFDAYHDLERLVTYHLIEPLWAEMLEEHAGDDRVRRGGGRWARPDRARRRRAWSVAKRLFEGPLA